MLSGLGTLFDSGGCTGMQPAFSYNYAAKNIKRTRRILRNTGLLAFAAAAVRKG